MRHSIIAIASFTVLEALRNRIVALIIAICALALVLTEFVGETAVTETLEIKSGMLASLLRLSAVFIIGLFVTGSMVRELNDKGLELVLALPIPRAAYYFGKLLGFSIVALLTAVPVALCLLIFAPGEQVAIWLVSLSCELVVVSALSLLCLFTFNQMPVALGSVIGFYLLARSIDAIRLMGRGPLVDAAAASQLVIRTVIDAIAFLLPELHRFTQSSWLMYQSAEWSDLLPIIGQTSIYLLLLAGAGLFDLYRKEL